MSTGADLVASAKTRLDWQYVVDEHRLVGDTHTTDCSGFIYLAAKDCGVTAPVVSSTQALWCHKAGTDGLDIGVALRIIGALLFKGPNHGFDGIGNDGHVAMSMGDGVNIIEAEGSRRDILIDPALGEGHPWTNAALMPGIDYGTGPLHLPPGTIIEGNSMYQPDEICDVFTDGHGNTWGLKPTGAIFSLTGEDNFYGGYPNLRDAAGHPLPSRTDFGHITARWDQRPGVPPKVGYTIWSVNYRKGEHYDFGPDHPGHVVI